jgi:hypothetical protein
MLIDLNLVYGIHFLIIYKKLITMCYITRCKITKKCNRVDYINLQDLDTKNAFLNTCT